MNQEKPLLEDIFFLTTDYSSYSSKEFPYGRYNLIPLEDERIRIGQAHIPQLKRAYNIASSRVEEIVGKKINDIFFNIKHSKGDALYYISKEMNEIYAYIHRIFEIRKFIIGLYPEPLSAYDQESYLSSVFGHFDEISFLTFIFYNCNPGINKKNKSHQKLLCIMQKQYMEHKTNEIGKVR